MKNTLSAEICKKCGECCKHFPFIELTDNDIRVLEVLAKLDFKAFTNQKGEVAEGYFLQFKENGDCFFLKNNDGCYSCGAYEARPGICKNYPSERLQKKACGANRERVLNKNFA